MLFDMPAWKLVDKHYPLTIPEIQELRQAVSDSGLLLHALISWAETIKDNFPSTENNCG